MFSREPPISADEFDRRLAKLLVATADGSDPEINRSVTEVLRLVREHLLMDVVFASQFLNGQRVFRHVEQDESQPVIQVGHSDPLDLTACKAVVDGRLPPLVRNVPKLPNFEELPKAPFPVGAYLSCAITLRDGALYGTLCCVSFAPNEQLAARDLKRLQMAAAMIARLIDWARDHEQNNVTAPACSSAPAYHPEVTAAAAFRH